MVRYLNDFSASSDNAPGFPSGPVTPSPTSDSSRKPAQMPSDHGPRQLSTRELIELLHGELRMLAAARMRSERPDHTLSPTALVHEAFLRLEREGHGWESKAQFFKAAAEAMRRVLIDSALTHATAKRGGGRVRLPLETVANVSYAPEVVLNIDGDPNIDHERLDAALSALKEESIDIYWIVMLRYFDGLSAEKTAEVLEITERTVHRRWAAAKLFLYDQCRRPSDA